MEKAIADRWFGTHLDGRATDCRVGEVNKLSRAEALLCFVRHPQLHTGRTSKRSKRRVGKFDWTELN